MAYSINVPSSGPYTVTYRVASLAGGGTIRLEKQGGSPSYGTVAVGPTGGWQNWQTITQTIQLSAGQQNIAIAAVAGGFNLNWFSISGGGGGFSQTIQAESYSVMSGVQTEGTSDSGGGLNVGWIDTNDWMKYPGIVIPSQGIYLVEYRVASPNSNGVLSQDLNAGAIQLGTINVPNTGGWQTWQTISRSITLNAGTYDFGIFAKTGGWNINWWRISKPAGGRIASSESFDLTGENELIIHPNPSAGNVTIRVVKPSQVTVLDATGKSQFNAHVEEQVTLEQLKSGLYIIRMQHVGGSATKKLIVK
jgi:endoglucanase